MVQRSFIRVKAMLILLSEDHRSQAVAKLRPTAEHPDGYHRLIGGGVERGETAVQALAREVREELGATVVDPCLLEVVENIFRINGKLGHEIIFVFGATIAESGVIPARGAMFTDDDDPMWVEWRPLDDDAEPLPLFPDEASDLARQLAAR